jgi:hypothetical protein
MPSNDLIANAVIVDIATDGGTYISPAMDNTAFGVEANEPAAVSGNYRTAWWRYTPLASGTVDLDTHATTLISGSTDTVLVVYTGTPNPGVNGWGLTEVAYSDDDSGFGVTSGINGLAVSAATTYWIRVGAFDLAYLMNYVLAVTGPHSTQPPTVVVDLGTSATLSLDKALASSDLGIDIFTGPLLLSPDPIDVYVQVAATYVQPVAPIDVYITVGPVSYAAVQHRAVQPADGATVPIRAPSFVIQLTRTFGHLTTAEVHVSYSYLDAGTPTTVEMSKTVAVLPGLNQVTLLAVGPIPADDIEWTYWIDFGGIPTPVSVTRSFTIDTSAFDYDTQITWTAAAGIPVPHLWMVYPAVADPGGRATVFGHGMTEGAGTVSISGTPADIEDWTWVPASPRSTGDDRLIDTITGVADPEHFEVVFVVPHAQSGRLILQD